MGTVAEQPTPDAVGRLARGLAVLVALVAVTVLVGWAMNWGLLRSLLPGLVPMVPNAAVVLLMGAATLWIRSWGEAAPRWAVRLADALAALMLGYSVFVLVEYALGTSSPVDRWLLDQFEDVPPITRPGQPALMAASAFSLVALGLLRPPSWMRQASGLMACALVYFVVLSYLYDIPTFYRLLPTVPMALHTALSALALAVGMMALKPFGGLAKLVASPGTGGIMLRRTLLPALLAPLLLGWLRAEIERATDLPNLIDTGFLIMGTSAILLAVLWTSASYLDRLDARRREALEALRKAEAELDDLYQHAPCGYHSLDANGVFIRINQTELDWLGYTREELIGKLRFRDLLTPASLAVFERNFPAFKERGYVKDLKFDVVCKHGGIFPVLVSATAVRDPEGRYVMSRSTLYDRTELSRLEAALRQSEETWRTILQAVPDGIFLASRDGKIGFANGTAERMFGYEPGSMAGLDADDLLPERFHSLNAEVKRQLMADPRFEVITLSDLMGRRRNGTEFPIEAILGPVETPTGGMVVAGIRDLTERRRMMEEAVRQRLAAEQAREMEQLKDHLLSGISHEMKTPLSLITGYAELLEDRFPGDVELVGIQDGVRRLTEHLNRILDVSALVSQRLALYPAMVALEDLVADVRDGIEAACRAAGLELAVELAPDLPPVWGDSRRLTQLLLELTDNARRFSGHGGTVTIRLGAEDHHALLDVCDTGPGIAPEKQAVIWDAFSQLDTGDALRKGGLGLGLTLVKGIATLHGATVWLDSEPGRGSRFRVRFPIASERQAAQEAEEKPQGEPGLRESA